MTEGSPHKAKVAIASAAILNWVNDHSKRYKNDGKQDISIILKYLPTKHLLITMGKQQYAVKKLDGHHNNQVFRVDKPRSES